LKKNLANTKAHEDEKKGKFKPNWIGAYIVLVNYGKGTYKLSIIEGE